ncbi:MAG: hypothetical protein A2Y97_14130 [Nitrospirae bacterium RBG_13_39_12]|nr:MAG: hypothetical protein A2Y97_14130 [Nitrospirae bacterium RBG_13_39_12]
MLLRAIAKTLDFIIIAAAAEVIPRAGFFAGLAYLLIGDGLFDGRSFGKKIIGLRVVSADADKPCSFRDSILRNSIFGLGYLLYKIPWFGWVFIVIAMVLEFIILLGSKNGMRLGDEIAKTRVVATTTDTETLTGRLNAS